MAGADHDPPLLDIPHPRFKMVDPTIFTKTLVADCMSHSCRNRVPDSAQLDACCQYGADVDLAERDAIMTHAVELRALLRPAAAAAPWFTTDVHEDVDFPSGKHVRTALFEGACVFLQHEGRGCAIHRASIEGGWDFHGTKPNICRLFPLTYDHDSILLADDYVDYSCAFEPGAPSVYRVGRDTLRGIFGDELVAALDAAEQAVLAAQPKRLPVV
jgi:Fe-S-cluster containining protein